MSKDNIILDQEIEKSLIVVAGFACAGVFCAERILEILRVY